MTGVAEPLPAPASTERGRSVPIARAAVARALAWPVAKQFLAVLIVLFVVKQAINVVIFPPFSGHDEVAHYAYARTVATEHRVPVIPDLAEFRKDLAANRPKDSGDFIPDDLYKYCHYVLDWGYCTDSQWMNNPVRALRYPDGTLYPSGWQYAANHPPLYYLYLTPFYWATDRFSPATQQYVFRAASIPFGLLIVLLAYGIIRTLFPSDQFLAITVPAFVAFQPQVSYEAAMVNNDIASIAAFSAILYLLIRGLRYGFSYRLAAVIGFAAGLGLLAKSTTLTALPLAAVAIFLACGWRNVRQWLSLGAVVGLVAGAVAWPWYLFLYRTYGNFSALDQVAELQKGETWENLRIDPPTIWDQLTDKDFAVMRWRETWGEFGWRLIHLHDGLLIAIGVPCLAGLVGFFVYLALAVRAGRRGDDGDPCASIAIPRLERWQRIGLLVIVLAAVGSYFAMLQFGTRFTLTQARYFFPAMIAYAAIIMIGLRTLIPVRWHRYGQGVVVGALVLLNVLIYTQYVVPYWYLGS